MKILILFTFPLSCSKCVWQKIFLRIQVTKQLTGPTDFHSIGKKILYKSMGLSTFFKIPLCSAEERNSYSFGRTWGWRNDDRIFILYCKSHNTSDLVKAFHHLVAPLNFKINVMSDDDYGGKYHYVIHSFGLHIAFTIKVLQ